MKHIFQKSLFLLSMIMLACVCSLQAQVVDTTGIGGFNPGNDLGNLGGLIEWYNLLYGALVIIWGYVAKAVGLKTKFPHFVFVVLAGAMVLGAAFLALGFSKVFPLLFSFLASIGVYDLIFKPAKQIIGGVKA